MYRDLMTQNAIDQQYNPSQGRTDGPAIMAGFAQRSAETRARLEHRLDLQYGPTLAETLDFFPADSPNAPLHVFIHGGYWRALSSKEFSYVADGLVQDGVSVAVVNYALCPEVTLSEIVRQCRSAMAWLYQQADTLGVNRDNITVSGHSAGGHLVGTLLATRWQHDYGLPEDLLKGACAISGLFDLAPFPYSWLQPMLQLSWREVMQYSPLNMSSHSQCPLVAAVGGLESTEFHRQSTTYTEALLAQQPARSVTYLSVSGTDHFSIVDQLAEGQGPLFAAVLEQINSGRQTPRTG